MITENTPISAGVRSRAMIIEEMTAMETPE